MKETCYKTIIILVSLGITFHVISQNSPDDMKVALVYKIANQVKWSSDTNQRFRIGVLSDNKLLIRKFIELSEIAEINNKKIEVLPFLNIKSIQPVQLIYVDQIYNSVLSSLFNKIGRQSTLVVSEEFDQPGEIMINLKLDQKKHLLTFEYNRANILFQGLELSEKIVVLKGTEIEIRELYLRAKTLWDNQKAELESLKTQSTIQNQSLLLQKDSIQLMKKNILENYKTIEKQTGIINEKDSISGHLNLKIQKQQDLIIANNQRVNSLLQELISNESLIQNHKLTIHLQRKLSDSLTDDIILKKKELIERKKALEKKEALIQKQYYGLLISFLIIAIVLISIFLILRAYFFIKRTKQKIAEQKEELEITLEQLKSTQQQLIQSEKMASLGVLVAGIAHEINNPVNFISSGIDGVETVIEEAAIMVKELNKLHENQNIEIKKLLDFKDQLQIENTLKWIPEIIENIKVGVKRTIEITNGLRLYSHIDKEEKSLFNINQIIDTALLLTKSQTDNLIEITTSFEPVPEIFVLPGKLSQVFVNIISNAVDSINESRVKNTADEKASISISTKILDNNIIIQFTDTGTGIPNEIIDRIFDPFYTTKKVGKGTGLGLSITLGIIEEHNGRIYARNNADKGATFIIELPIEQRKI